MVTMVSIVISAEGLKLASRILRDQMILSDSKSGKFYCGQRPRALRGCRGYHVRYCVDYVINRMKLIWMRQQCVRHSQRAGFTSAAHSRILNGIKINDMGETENAANHLACAEAEHVGE